MATSYDSDITLSVGLTTEDVMDKARQLNDEIAQVFENAKGVDVSARFKSLLLTLDSLSSKSRQLQEELEMIQFRASIGKSQPGDLEQYEKLTQQLNQVNNKTILLQERLSGLGENDAPTRLSSRFGSLVAKLGQGAVAATRFGVSLSGSAIKKAVGPITTLVSKLGQLAKGQIVSGIKRLGKAIANLGKKSSGTNMSFDKGFKFLIRYGLGVRSVFALVNKLRRALTEGFGNLAQVHQPFNDAMSQIMTSLNLLKNTFAAAFAPIIETVAPILSYFINLMAKAVSVVGQFIAALTGKEYVQAAAVQVDYASSVNKSTSSSKKNTKATKDQTKAAKELKKTLAGFDDIEILHDDKDNSSSAPDTAESPGYSFSPAPIGEAVDKFAKDFKAAWADADFTDIGRIVGEKIKSALEKIPWGEIQATLRKVGESIATFLNGVLETNGLFTRIGYTLAEAINSAIEFLYSFVHNFHWDSLGYAIRDGILGALNNIRWTRIYDTAKELGGGIGTAIDKALNNRGIWTAIFTTISNGLNTVLFSVDSFITSIGWDSLGENIGNGLNDGVEMFNWDLLSQTLIDAINGAFDLWYNFVTTFDFKKFGEHIGQTISDVINEVDWEKGADSVAETINGLFSALRGFVQKIQWKILGKKVISTIVRFFRTLDWGNYAGTLSDVAKSLLDALTGAFEGVDWDTLPDEIAGAISDFLEGFDWDGVAESVGQLIGAAFKAIIAVGGALLADMKEFGQSIIDGGFDGIITALKNVVGWIREHIVTPFIDGFKTAFGINSPSKKMKPYGRYILLGLLEGIGDAIASIGDWIKNRIFTPFMDAVKSAFGIGGEEPALFKYGAEIFQSFQDGISSLADSITTWVDEHIVQPFLKGFQLIKDAILGLFNSDGDPYGLEYMEEAAETVDTFSESVAYLHQVATNDGDLSGWEELRSAISKLHDEGLLTDEAFGGLSRSIGDATRDGISLDTEIGKVVTTLGSAGISADEFNRVLGLTPDKVNNAATSISSLGESADTANTNTEGASSALDSFAGLGWSVPLKIALLSGAIDLLANSGKLSEEQTEKLHETLDNYKAKPTQDNMKKVSDAFDDAGVSATDFQKALIESAQKAGKNLDPEFRKMISDTNNFSKDFGDGGTDAGEKFSSGLNNQLDTAKSDVNKKVKSLADDDMLGTLDTELDSHSPSREAAKRGRYFVEGLQSGVESTKDRFMSVVQSVANDMVDKFDETDWTSIGTEIVTKINDGIVQTQYNVISSAGELASSIYDNANSGDWVSIGSNICSGIVNGLWGGWNWVVSVAQDLAISAYNAARWALGIASPSKKFAWIGEMVTEGFGKGIADNENNAVDAMSDLTSAVSDEAEKTNPAVALASSIDGWIESLDFILTEFSNTVIDKFDSLISSLETITQLSINGVPDIANGKVIPSSIRTSSASADTMGKLIESINGLTNNQITPDELRAMLVEVVRDYFSTTFYIGDEQIARHANAGNLKLDVKYNIM